MIIIEPSSCTTQCSQYSTRLGTTWFWKNSCSTLTRSRLPRRCSAPTTPLLYLIPLTMAARVKATRARATSPALPRLPGPPSIILGLGLPTCTLVRLPGGQQQHRLSQQQAIIVAHGPTMVGPPFTPPLASIPALLQMYTAQ
jgi:hypothetical protein